MKCETVSGSPVFFGIDLGVRHSAIVGVDVEGRLVSAHRLGRGISPSEDLCASNPAESIGLDDPNFLENRWLAIIFAELSQCMQQQAGHEVRAPMIAIPAHFGFRERESIMRSGRLAGLDVDDFVTTAAAVVLSDGSAIDGHQWVLVCVLDPAGFECSILHLKRRGEEIMEVEVILVDGENWYLSESEDDMADDRCVARACEIVDDLLALASTRLEVPLDALVVAGGSVHAQRLEEALLLRRSWSASRTMAGLPAAEGAALLSLKRRRQREASTVGLPGPSDVFEFIASVGVDQASNVAWVVVGYATSKLMGAVRGWKPRHEITPEIATRAAVEIALQIDPSLSEANMSPVKVTHHPPGKWEVELALPSRTIVVALTNRGQRIEGVIASDERLLH